MLNFISFYMKLYRNCCFTTKNKHFCTVFVSAKIERQRVNFFFALFIFQHCFLLRGQSILNTMATKCSSCNNNISSSEFVSCAGACGQMFHIKCVSVNKSMLNAVSMCPNIHWFCHKCNEGNRNICASIERMNETIGLMSNSLSGDFLKFINNFKIIMDTFVGTVNSLNVVANSDSGYDLSTVPSPNVTIADQASDIQNNLADVSNRKQLKSDEVPVTDDRNYSVVVSNIGTDVSADSLTEYLVNELNIDKKLITSSVLLPKGKSMDDVSYLQYKVTIPAIHYSSLLNPELWPKNVRVRDFVSKIKSNCGVQMQHFVPKKKLCLSVDSSSVA